MYLKLGNTWILGEPFLKQFFITVDLDQKSLTFFNVGIVEVTTDGVFERIEIWIIILSTVFGSLIIYLIAAGIYQIIKKKIDSYDDGPLLKNYPDKKIRNL